MENVITTAIGTFIGVGGVVLVMETKSAAARRRKAREMHRAMSGAVDALMDHLASPEHEAHVQAAKKKPVRRKPATQGKGKIKGATPVAKKGATNAKAKARR